MAEKNQSAPATSQPTTKDVPTLVSSNPGASPAVPQKGSNPGRGKGEGEGEFSGSRGARGRGGREGRDGRDGRGRGGRGGRGGDDRINQIPEKDRTRVYLGHLPLDIEEAEIISLCTPYGPVTSVTSVKKKGIAFVTFKTHEGAQMALYDLGFKKRKYRDDFIEIDWAKPEAKKGGENEENADDNKDVNTKGAKVGDKTEASDKDATEKKEEVPKRPLFSEMQKAKVATKKPPTPQAQKKTNTPNASATGIQVAKPSEAPAPVASAPTQETKTAKKDNKAAEPNKGKNQNNKNQQTTSQAQAPAQEKVANKNQKAQTQPASTAQTQQNKQPQKKQQNNNQTSQAKYEVKVREIASGENKITLNSVSADAVEKFVKPLKSVKFEVVYKNEATGEENTARMTESEFQQYFLPLVQSHNSAALGLTSN